MSELRPVHIIRQERTADAAIEALYERVFPAVARFISKRNGSFEDARDIFHDALVLFYERSSDPGFRVNTTEEAYIMGIARHLWFQQFRKEQGKGHVLLQDEFIDTVAEQEVNNLRLLRLLETTGRKCMDLLRAFYYRKGPVKQVAEALGYRSERSATVQKYKCMEKVRDTIKKESLSYADFLN